MKELARQRNLEVKESAITDIGGLDKAGDSTYR